MPVEQIWLEVLKQGPATVTLVALSVLAAAAFKYFAVFANSATQHITEERREFVALAMGTKDAIGELTSAINRLVSTQDRLASTQDRIVAAMESLPCNDTYRPIKFRNGKL